MTEGDGYQVRILGWMDERWQSWFDGWTVAAEQAADGQPITLLTGVVADQAALRGLLCRIWDLNLVVISVNREEAPLAQMAHSRAEERAS